MSELITVRATALEDNHRKFGVVCLGVKLAVAFGRDSGGRVAHGARMLSGCIGSGGSRANWYCSVESGSVFEFEVDAEAYRKNKNRLTKWAVEEISGFSTSPARAAAMAAASNNLE